jgi:hypothetical protein
MVTFLPMAAEPCPMIMAAMALSMSPLNKTMVVFRRYWLL